MPRYALHPGPITSKTDGQKHDIGADQLAQLYGVRRSECVIWREKSGRVWDDYIHLYPSYHGNYQLPGRT